MVTWHYFIIIIVLFYTFNIQSANENYFDEKIIISEICIKKENNEYPKWLVLISNLNETINLKNWSLSDSQKCFYKFTENINIEPKGILMICFYPDDTPSSDFKDKISANVNQIIDIFKCEPFDSKGEYNISQILINKTVPLYLSLGEKQSIHELEQTTGPMYKWFYDESLKYIKINNYPDNYKYPIMSIMSQIPREYDEVALIDDKNNLISYISWGNQANVKPSHEFKWEKQVKDNCSLYRTYPLTINIKSTNAIILKRISKSIFEFEKDIKSSFLK